MTTIERAVKCLRGRRLGRRRTVVDDGAGMPHRLLDEVMRWYGVERRSTLQAPLDAMPRRASRAVPDGETGPGRPTDKWWIDRAPSCA